MYIMESWIEMFKFVIFVKNYVFRHELGMSNEWIVEKLNMYIMESWIEMFKFVIFVKNHVLGHELGMSNEWIVEKLCSLLNGKFGQISVNNSENLPNLTWNWCLIMLYNEINDWVKN